MITIKGIAELHGPANEQSIEPTRAVLERRLGVFVWEFGAHSMAENHPEMLCSLDDIENVTRLLRENIEASDSGSEPAA